MCDIIMVAYVSELITNVTPSVNSIFIRVQLGLYSSDEESFRLSNVF